MVTKIITITVSFSFLFLSGCMQDNYLIIKTSIPQTEIVQEFRSASEACSQSLKEIENDYSAKECKIINSARINGLDGTKECVGKASMNGCFVCELECQKK